MMADMPPGVRRLLLMTAAITGEIPEELKVLAGIDFASDPSTTVIRERREPPQLPTIRECIPQRPSKRINRFGRGHCVECGVPLGCASGSRCMNRSCRQVNKAVSRW